jgi:hypothetical protein
VRAPSFGNAIFTPPLPDVSPAATPCEPGMRYQGSLHSPLPRLRSKIVVKVSPWVTITFSHLHHKQLLESLTWDNSIFIIVTFLIVWAVPCSKDPPSSRLVIANHVLEDEVLVAGFEARPHVMDARSF